MTTTYFPLDQLIGRTISDALAGGAEGDLVTLLLTLIDSDDHNITRIDTNLAARLAADHAALAIRNAGVFHHAGNRLNLDDLAAAIRAANPAGASGGTHPNVDLADTPRNALTTLIVAWPDGQTDSERFAAELHRTGWALTARNAELAARLRTAAAHAEQLTYAGDPNVRPAHSDLRAAARLVEPVD